MTTERAEVPCNGCRLCCINQAVFLIPEDGDDPAIYDTMPARNPLTGTPGLRLRHKPNGECVYLDERGCTIHDHAPVICQAYDCRAQYLRMPRAVRRSAVARGLMSKDQFDAGRQRAHTLAKPPGGRS